MASQQMNAIRLEAEILIDTIERPFHSVDVLSTQTRSIRYRYGQSLGYGTGTVFSDCHKWLTIFSRCQCAKIEFHFATGNPSCTCRCDQFSRGREGNLLKNMAAVQVRTRKTRFQQHSRRGRRGRRGGAQVSTAQGAKKDF